MVRVDTKREAPQRWRIICLVAARQTRGRRHSHERRRAPFV